MTHIDLSSGPLQKRVHSLDAFRGFIMLSMLAGTLGLKDLSANPLIGFVYTQLTHAPWRGFHFEDLILPSFLFMIGMAMALSAAKRRDQSESPSLRMKHAAIRAATLFFLGFILSWISNGKPYIGAGVLQVLAVSFFIAYMFIDFTARGQWIAFFSLLFIYWFFIFTVPVPEAGRNSYVIYKNLVFWIDDILTGSATRWGYLYTLITSAAVVVYGAIIGKKLMARKSHGEFMKTLAIYGVILVAAGLLLNPFIPIIKRMFTPSYTLFTCGLTTLVFLGFYWLIDVRGYRKWSFVFIVLGLNSIFVYMLNGLLSGWFMTTAAIFITPLGGIIGGWTAPLTHVTRLTAEWLICLYIYRRKIFLKL